MQLHIDKSRGLRRIFFLASSEGHGPKLYFVCLLVLPPFVFLFPTCVPNENGTCVYRVLSMPSSSHLSDIWWPWMAFLPFLCWHICVVVVCCERWLWQVSMPVLTWQRGGFPGSFRRWCMQLLAVEKIGALLSSILVCSCIFRRVLLARVESSCLTRYVICP